MPELLPSTPLFRNYDHAFEKQLSKPSAERKISVAITFTDTPSGFALAMADEAGGSVVVEEAFQKEQAVGSQEANIRRQLSKLGNTPFEASAVRLDMSDKWFVPSSLLSEMRRKGVERLLDVRNGLHRLAAGRRETPPSLLPFPEQALTYLGNVSNSRAEAFYRACRVASIEPAFELSPRAGVPLMFTRHCLRRSMGWCPSLQKQESPYQEPLYLLHKNTRLKLQFDCANCLMLISSLA
jgi:putative protease